MVWWVLVKSRSQGWKVGWGKAPGIPSGQAGPGAASSPHRPARSVHRFSDSDPGTASEMPESEHQNDFQMSYLPDAI